MNPNLSNPINTANANTNMSGLLASLKMQIEKVIEFTPNGPKDTIINSH